MPLITVYDKDNKPHTIETVDAREYIATGDYSSEPWPVAAPAPVEKVVVATPEPAPFAKPAAPVTAQKKG